MPSYIVPRSSYGLGRAAIRYAPYYSNLKYMAARAAIRNAPRIYTGTKRSARVIQRAYRKYRSAKRVRRTRVTGASKSNKQVRRWLFGTSDGNFNMERKTLYRTTIRFANQPDTNDGIRQAPGMVFHVSGFKLCATLRNVGELPIHVHMAIVQPKQPNIVGSELDENFFSEGNSLITRYSDFSPFTTSSTWNRNQDCNPLNKKKFNIFFHKKFILSNLKNPSGVIGADDENPNRANYLHFERYYKLNKKFEFETQTSTEVMKPMWLLMWYETLFPTNAATGQLSTNVNLISYIREN